MSDREGRFPGDRQALAEQKYAALKRAVEEAGFFAPHVKGDERCDCLVCTSKFQKRYGYTGLILCVTEAGGHWFLATPHPYHYRVLDPSQVEQAVIAFLAADRRRKSNRRTGDGVGELQDKIVAISHEEYEQALGRGRCPDSLT